MQIDYALIQAYDDNFFEGMASLERRVKYKMSNGWEVSGDLIIREDVTYSRRNENSIGGYETVKVTFYIQPMILTIEAKEGIALARAIDSREYRKKWFPDLLRGKRINEQIASGVTIEELATQYNRKPSTIRTWLADCSAHYKWLQEDPELVQQFALYEAEALETKEAP